MKSFVVDFKLPNDEHLFIHHAMNVNAVDEMQARSRFSNKMPTVKILAVLPGMVNTYGKHYATYDSTGGMPFGPCASFRHATSGIQGCLPGLPPPTAFD